MSTLKEILGTQPGSAKSSLVIGLIIIILATFGAVYWALSGSYAVLFKDLEEQDAAAVVSELEESKVSYKLKDGGRTILVPEESVHRIRLQTMSSEARLIGGIGFELFDNSDFGMTEFVQKINYQRALQGELTRTITSLDEIKYARVHLVMPESSIFRQEGKTSSAAVTLFMKDGYRLKEQQIAGIQKLIASSVPGMDVSAVTVTNQNGVVMSQNLSEETGAGIVSQRLQMRKEVESYLTNKVTKILEGTFGQNQALVSVDVALNMDKVMTTMENVIPNKESQTGVVRKRETKNQTDKKSDNVTTEVEYHLGKKVDQIVTAPGGISHISVSVIVPRDTTNTRILQIEELVAAAIGIDRKRGDEIVVHAVAIPASVPDSVAKNHNTGDVKESNFKTYIDQSLIEKAFSKAEAVGPIESETSNTDLQKVDPQVVTSSKNEESRFSLEDYMSQVANISLADIKYHLLVKHLEITIVASVLFVVIFISILLLRISRRTATLNTVQREQMLKQLQTWIEGESSNTVQEVKP